MLSQNNNSPVIQGVGEDAETLQKLLISAKHGDTKAFGDVYTRLFTPLYRYVLSRCHSKEITDDICQQTFLNFYEALASYKPEKHPLAYLFTIARRLLINHHQKNKPISFDETILEAVHDESVDIIEETHIHLLANHVMTHIASLTDDEQEVIRLYYFGELTYDEIATTLTTSNANIRKIKERALKKLRVLYTQNP